LFIEDIILATPVNIKPKDTNAINTPVAISGNAKATIASAIAIIPSPILVKGEDLLPIKNEEKNEADTDCCSSG
jgi:hypothetical protein